MDPTDLATTAAAGVSGVAADASLWMEAATTSSVLSSTNLLSFTDQGQNLAGTFFQASLLPYLLFLYFLSFRANRISSLGNFGFQFVLLFVLTTIPSGIVTKSVYGTSLANTDWLHGGAELLLTLANIFIVSPLKEIGLVGKHTTIPLSCKKGSQIMINSISCNDSGPGFHASYDKPQPSAC